MFDETKSTSLNISKFHTEKRKRLKTTMKKRLKDKTG